MKHVIDPLLVIAGQLDGIQPMTVRQLTALLICYSEGKQTVRGLAEKMGVSKPVITRLVQHFKEEGLLSVTQDAHDRRSVCISCTSDSLTRLARAEEMMRA